MLARRRSRNRSTILAALAATAVLAAAVTLLLLPGDDAVSKGPAAAPTAATARADVDATIAAETRQMRHATRLLAGELAAAARCDAGLPPRRFAPCVVPALRHGGMGGRMNAHLLQTVLAPLPAGRCREYLFGLQMANAAASDSARWLMPRLYGSGRRARQSHLRGQIALDASMLRHVLRAAGARICSPGADGPAI